MTDFATAMELTPIGDRRWSATISADWSQGRTTFGGLLAALAARVATQVVGAERPIRTMDVAFVAPIPPGPVELDVEMLGEGKAVSQLVVSLRSGGALGCRVHVVAGAARASAVRVDAPPPEIIEGDPADQGISFSHIPGVTPEFSQHIEYRWCSALPFSGGGPETAYLKGWARHRIPVRGVEATVALLDAWPPVVLPTVDRPTPASTVRWALHLSDLNGLDQEELLGTGTDDDPAEVTADAEPEGPWFWYEARTVQCADGYATAYASMYAGDRLVAWSEQLIAVYDRPTAAEPGQTSTARP
jgi:Thioesterase-like superfamily